MRKNYKQRMATGSVLAEAAAGSVIVTTVFVLLVAFSVNMFFLCMYSAKLQIVAAESAKIIIDSRFWNGAQRPLFQLSNEKQQATKAAVESHAADLCKELGLPGTPVVEIADTKVNSKRGTAYTKVTVSISTIPLPFNLTRIFPSFFGASAVGIASESIEAPPAFIRLGYKLNHPEGSVPSASNAQQVVILPAYGFQTDFKNSTNSANLGGTQRNNDVVANQPDSNIACWNGIYYGKDASGTPSLVGTPPLIGNTHLFQ